MSSTLDNEFRNGLSKKPSKRRRLKIIARSRLWLNSFSLATFGGGAL